MLHRSVTFAHAVFLVFSVVLAFLLMRNSDENSVTGESAVLLLDESAETADSAQVVEAVESFTQEHGVAIGLDVPDLHAPERLRHLYLAVGDPDSSTASWLTDGYPAFGRDVHTAVHPFSDIGQADPRGLYYFFGPRDLVYTFQDAMAELGLSGYVPPEVGLGGLIDFFLHGALKDAFILVLLCGVVAIGSGVLLNAKPYGILRLQGKSFSQILARDLTQLGRFWLPAFVLTAAATLVFLAVYNGFAQFGLFLGVAGYFLRAFALSGLAAHAAALALAHAAPVLHALKGKVPARLATVSAYAVRIPAMVLVFGVLGAASASVQQIQAQHASREAYAQIGDATHVRVTGSVSDQEAMVATIGPWLRQADADGQVVVTARGSSEEFLPYGSPHLEFDVLVVNDTYLARHPVLSPSGHRYDAAQEENRVRVLIPETLEHRSADITAATTVWVGEFQGRDNPDLDFDVEALPTSSGQSVFTYSSKSYGFGEEHFLHDPLIVAVPNGSDVLHDRSYFDYATQAAVIFPDPGDVSDAIADPPLSTYINGVRPVAQKAAEDYRASVREFRLEVFNLAAGTAVLLVTGIGVCVIYSRKNAQSVFARHISGWSFIATHRSLLAVEALLVFAFVGWATWDTVTVLNDLADPRTPGLRPDQIPVTGVEPLLASAIAALSLGLTVTALTVFHRRIVKEGVSQA